MEYVEWAMRKYCSSITAFCIVNKKVNFALPTVNFPQYYVVVFFHLKLFLFPLIFIEHRNSTNWNRHTHTHRTPVPTLDFPIPYYGPIHAYCSSVTDGHNQKRNSVDQGPTNIPSFPLSIKKKKKNTRHGASSSSFSSSSSSSTATFFFFFCCVFFFSHFFFFFCL